MQKAELNRISFSGENVIATSGFMSGFSEKSYGFYATCSEGTLKGTLKASGTSEPVLSFNIGNFTQNSYKFYTDEDGTEFNNDSSFFGSYYYLTNHGVYDSNGTDKFHYKYDGSTYEFVLCKVDEHVAKSN